MKCAGELIAISLENAEKKRIREEQERLERERKAVERLKILKKRTVNWCEKIGKILEEKATNAQPLEYNIILCESNLTKDICYTLEKVPSRYSDNRADYSVNYNEEIYLPTITEFFEKYCFKVSYWTERIYSYGSGARRAVRVIIKPAPQCFKK